MSRLGSGFLAAYEDWSGADRDVLALRLTGTGAVIGTTLQLATGAGDQTAPVAEASADKALVLWDAPTGLSVRTVSSTGTLGVARTLAPGSDPADPTLTGGGSGTWFAAWTETATGRDVVGSKVSPTGLPANPEFAPTLAGGAGDQVRPILTRGSGGTTFLTWTDLRTGQRRDQVQRVSAGGSPTGPITRSTRSPVAQVCNDVAAGAGQFLVVWHEERIEGDTNLYARRYGADGAPKGGLITVSTASGDQVCPRAAWNGSHWLVTWTDRRAGTADIFATTVSGAGAVAPTGGFAVSSRTAEQQSPEVAWNGTDWVVAWNDQRNGNQDIYAARVRSDRSVRDPNGIAVTTAPGPQRRPTVASAGGPTLIAWVTQAPVQHRVLRANGTFASPVRSVGDAWEGLYDTIVAAAAPDRLGVVFRSDVADENFDHQVVFAGIDPADGSPLASTPLHTVTADQGFDAADIAWDGSRFIFQISYYDGIYGLARLGSLTGSSVRAGYVPIEYSGMLASLPDGRSLLLGTRQGTLLVAAVDDAP